MAVHFSGEETRNSLLVGVGKGNADSWSEFVSLYEPLLMSYVLSQGLPRHEAGDVVQDIFIKLFRTLPNFKLDHARGRFRTWLWQITSTTIVDWARRRKRQARLEEAVRKRLEALEGQQNQPEPEWDRRYEERVMKFVLETVRESTQPKTWACFEEHTLKGRPSAEVGAELDLSPNSVNVNASRVLARVREQCAYYREELEMSDRACLEEEDLLPLAGGEPIPPDVQQHLDGCAVCRERLKQLSSEVASLRRARQDSAYFGAAAAPPGEAAPDDIGESFFQAPQSRSTKRPAAIGKYFVAGLLDEMETTYTYRALHPTFNKELLIKLGRQKSELEPAEQKALLEEGKRLAQLDHPGLVKVYDLDFFKNRPFLVMEHVPGTTLRKYREDNAVSAVEAAALVAKVARGLGEVHRRGMIHQEVYPTNILLGENGQPRLAFGLASLRQRQPDEGTQSVSIRLHFMAPEQARGDKEHLGPHSDIFSLGCVLYFLLTGKLPFEGKDPFDSLKRVRHVDYDQQALRTAGVPARLDAICARAMEPEPAARFPSADAMADQLEAFVRHPRGPLLLWAGLGLAVVGAAVAAYFLLQ